MTQRPRLRTQLLASYLVLLAITLGIIGAALFVFVSTRPAPPEPTYQRLAVLIQGLTGREMVREFTPGRGRNRQPLNLENLQAVMEDFSATNQVRVMMIMQRGERSSLLLDTENATLDEIDINTDSAFNSPRLAGALAPGTRQTYGKINHADGSEWLFGGTIWEIGERLNAPGRLIVMVAEPLQTASLQEVLSAFYNSLLPPIIQAGVIGFIIAVALAFLISRGIARPLQKLASAATAIARGDYGAPTPDTGPREVVALSQAFQQMSHDVQAAQQSQRDFLANVSHDLKTPLTSIQGYSQAIMDGAAKNPADAAQIIHDEAERLNRMVVELTDLARMQSGRLSLKMNALDMGAIAAAIGQRLSIVAHKKHIKLHVEAQPLPHIAGDGDRMAQVLTNLLSNAIKYTPGGGDVWLQTGVRNGGIEISVRDTGIGIPKHDLPRIFERFYQVDKARGPQRGTGLGLAITREIVQAHGGTIQVFSKGSGQGTTFTLWLPSPQLSTLITRQV